MNFSKIKKMSTHLTGQATVKLSKQKKICLGLITYLLTVCIKYTVFLITTLINSLFHSLSFLPACTSYVLLDNPDCFIK